MTPATAAFRNGARLSQRPGFAIARCAAPSETRCVTSAA